MTVGIFIQAVLNGLGLGMTYLLIVLGLDVIIRGTKIINFAHGQIYMLGGYTFFIVYGLCGLLGVSFWLAVAAAALAVAILGALCYWVVFNPLQRQFKVGTTADYRLLMTAMASVGLMMIFQQGAVLVFGTHERGVPAAFPQMITIGEIYFPLAKLVILIMGLIVIFLLYVFFFKTRLGKAIRAVSFDPEVSSLQGINTFWVSLVCFALGCALAGIAGAAAVSIYAVSPMMGTRVIFIALLVLVVGGIGSYKGTILGALIIGLGLGLGYQLIGGLAHVFVFALALVILIFRPGGLLGEVLR